ncbi:MAG: hypothetical protein N2C14_08485, partial [Planctomycetales bacterium]
MYPSGTWKGYWEQEGIGRQPMGELQLRFSPSGVVEGEGRDLVGAFRFTGEVSERGSITLVKH